ncbi:MAG: septum site-determining protein MinC [Clostridium sp.]
MQKSRIIIKGNREGLNAVININAFSDFEDMLNALVEKLSKGKKFYKGSTLTITTELKYIKASEIRKLKDILFDVFMIKDCVFQDSEEEKNKIFTGVVEGRTKFIHKTIRSGQVIRYSGNLVVLGDLNPGAEIYAAGNIIVFGNLRGIVHAGSDGNNKAIIAALKLQPQLIDIAGVVNRGIEEDDEPYYPEVARLKNNSIVVEPYTPNKYI